MLRNNTINYLLVIISCVISPFVFPQNPTYSNEKPVTINGLTFDAMEPHLSADGNAIFFNSLNDGLTTSLYYAARVNDTTFNFVGLVPVVNQTTTPRLDAVASVDTANNFYWVSTRDWPSVLENLQRIRFLTSSYTNFGKVYGDFYINAPGWLIMDAAVNHYGDKLIYCNAWFNSCTGVPCKASMGIAQKLNDSTFNKMANTDSWFANINDTTNYIVYAPFLSVDELELFYSRLLHNGTQTEVMVATRSNTNSAFGTPSVLVTAPSFLPEAPTVTVDKTKMYFHKKVGGIFKLFVRYRDLNTSLIEKSILDDISIYPNPTSGKVFIGSDQKYEISVCSIHGKVMKEVVDDEIDLGDLSNGIYILKVKNKGYSKNLKIIKN